MSQMRHAAFAPTFTLIVAVGVALLVAGCREDPAAPTAAAPAPTPAAPSGVPHAAPLAHGHPEETVETTVVGTVRSGVAPRPDKIIPIVVQPSEIDLGIVAPAATARGEVELFNVGDAPVTILKSTSSCACTSINLADVVIEPGSGVMLPATMNAGLTFGPKTATISIVFEGYDGVVKVPVKAEVALAVRTVPGYVSNRTPNSDEVSDVAQFTIESIDGAPFRVLAVQGDPPVFADFDPATDEPRAAYAMVFDFSRYHEHTCLDEAGRPMPPYLAVETDHPGARLVDLRVLHPCARHEAPEPGQNWSLAERRALIGAIEAGASAEFSVPLRWRPGSAIDAHILDIVSESPELAVELLEEYEEDNTLWYRVRVTPATEYRGLLYAKLRFRSARNDMALHVIGLVEAPTPASP